MTMYSSSQFFQDWRYAVDKDFVTNTGEPFPYAENGQQEWGDEVVKLTFGSEPHAACISHDGKYMAVAVEHDIHIVETVTFDVTTVLKGHTSRVENIAFKPGNSNILVSSSQYELRGSIPTMPIIIVWNIETYSPTPSLEPDALSNVSHLAAKTVRESLAQSQLHLTEPEKQELGRLFEPCVRQAILEHGAGKQQRIYGRIMNGFQSNSFSPSGKWMIYSAGDKLRSSNINPEIGICSAEDFGHHLTLRGHTEAIMWTGWSPDETSVGSVALDKSIRIWDSTSGQEVHRFTTDGQNWTGGFSPDSRSFAATDGGGKVHLYSLVDGTEYWVFDEPKRWIRALDWHPSGKYLALGGVNGGLIYLLDVKNRKRLQERKLSSVKSKPDDPKVDIVDTFVETFNVRFADGGRKLVTWSRGDSSVELFDLQRQEKWRFARGGTDSGPRSSQWIDENGKVTSKGGHGMVMWEDKLKSELILGSIDFDGVRIWSIRLTGTA